MSEHAGVPYNRKRRRAFNRIDAERIRQVEKWGGAEHDRQHGMSFWIALLSERVGRAASVLIDGVNNDAILTTMAYEDRLVEIAACAVAALEASDASDVAPVESP